MTAVVPAAENAVSGSSYRPADVVRHVGGRTTEVLNTDAEGRMVLADALAYARLELGATVLVDVATLTGAMKVALGTRTAGLFATTDGLADALRTAAVRAGEPLWRMPLLEEHRDLLDSPVADANNAPGNPGATTAALFLQPFAGDLPWAHLDVAGPARAGLRRRRAGQGRHRVRRAHAAALAGGRRTRPTRTDDRPRPRLSVPKSAGSLAGGAVDRLAQQVGVAGVPGGLLDHVQQHPAQVEVLPVAPLLAPTAGPGSPPRPRPPGCARRPARTGGAAPRARASAAVRNS